MNWWKKVASFPGSHAPEREIEVVQAWRAWYFCHVKNAKDRRQVDATLIVRGRM